MADVGTSTVAYATRNPSGQLVFIASDGTACVLWCDGVNQVISYASPPYSSWTKVTHTTGLNMVLGGDFRAGTDDIDTVTGGTANVRGNYRLLSKSGATWTVGASNALSGTVAIGVTATGDPLVYSGQDAQGRHWISVPGATHTAEKSYYSVANAPTNTGWTVSGSVAQTTDLFTPAADQIGNYLVKIYWNGTALQHHRIDNSVVSLGAWSTGATIPNLAGSPVATNAVCFRAISATKALLVYDSTTGIQAQTYDPSTNTFSTATALSSNATDRHPSIATAKDGTAYVVWASYVATNNFNLVYKKYDGASWDAGATTLAALADRVNYVNATYGAKTLAVTYTKGTASPYTVGWQVKVFGGIKNISTISAALSGPTSLVLYGSGVADSVLASAGAMTENTGGTETSKVTSYPSGTGNFGEVFALGGSSVAVASIPVTLSGYGWIYHPGPGTFTNNALWSAKITLSNSANSGTWRLRVMSRIGGVPTTLGTLTCNIANIAKTTYTFADTSCSGATLLSASDGIYFDLWYENTTGAGSDTVTVYEATLANAGVVNDFQVTTAPFLATSGVTYSNAITNVSAALQSTNSLAATNISAALQSLNNPKNISNISAALLQQNITKNISNISAALTVTQTKTINTVSTALIATNSQPVTNISGALKSLNNAKNVTNISGALQALGLSKPITNITAALQATVTTSLSVTLVSGVLKSLNNPKPITNISSALQAVGLSKNLTNISGALKSLNNPKSVTNVSASVATTTSVSATNISGALVQTTTKTISAVSATVSVTTGKSVSTISAALKATNVLPVTSVSGALKSFNNPLYITGVNAAIGQGGIAKAVTGVSAATIALGLSKNITGLSVALKQQNVQISTTGVSASVAQIFTKTITTVSVALVFTPSLSVTNISAALQSASVGKAVTNVSGALKSFNNLATIINISGALKSTTSLSVLAVSGALTQQNIAKNLTNISGDVAKTFGKNVTTVSSALRATNSKNVTTVSGALKATNTLSTTNISAAVGQGGIPKTVTNVSSALLAVNSKSLTSLSASLKQSNISVPVSSVSGALRQLNLPLPVVNIATALQATNHKNISNVSSSLQATVFQTILTISAAFVATETKPVANISSALKAFGVVKAVSGVSACVGQSAIPKALTNISAYITYVGFYYYVTVQACRSDVVVTGSQDSVSVSSARGDVTVTGVRNDVCVTGVRSDVTVSEV